MKVSVSRPAVPLPTAATSAPCFLARRRSVSPASVRALVRSGVRVDGRVFEQFPFTVEADDFAAGAETGVHGEDVLSAEGRGKQKLAQVFGEHADGFGVGALFELVAEFGLQRGREKPPVAVQRGCAHFAPAGAVVADEEAGQEVLRLLLIAGAQGEARKPSSSPRNMARMRWEGACAAGSSHAK